MIRGERDRRIIAASFVRILLYDQEIIICIFEYEKFMRDV
jgi:hypothetical protein